MSLPQLGPATIKKYNDLTEMVQDLAPYLGGAQRGRILRMQELVNAADITGVNGTAAQSPFAAANDVLTVEADTLYAFELFYHLTHGATTHTTSIGLTLATATIASMRGFSTSWSAAADTLATPQSRVITGAAAAAVTATSTAVETILRAEGHIRTTLGGTVSPFFLFSADPTGTILTKANSFFRLYELGAGSDVVINANAA